MQIVFEKYFDRDDVLAAMDAGDFEVTMVQQFVVGETEESVVNISDFDAIYLEAFLKTIDKFTYSISENAIVWKIAKTAKTYNLEGSYVRSALVSGVAIGVLEDGVPLRVRFEIPGFTSSNSREIDLWYNDAFNPTDLDLLAEIGISLSGNGAEFTIANNVDAKVSFRKPTGVTGVSYIITDQYANEIIAP
jgi:hypothetical protein